MRKVIFILLAFFYSTISSGAVVTLHYCVQEVVSCSMNHTTSNSTPNKCKRVQTANCCKIKTKLIKIDVAKNAELLQLQMASSFALLPDAGYVWQDALFYPKKSGQNSLNNVLLQYQQIPIFIRNCNFRL